MLKRIKSILLVISVIMVFTAQTNRPDDKGQHNAPAARPVEQSRPQAQTHNSQPSRQTVQHQQPKQQVHISQPVRQERPQPVHQENREPSHQQEQGPRVYAVRQAAPEQNDRFLHRQHSNHWQPRYNFYDYQYHFYPYVNIASMVELTSSCITIVFSGQNYYYDNGTFYIQDQTGQYVAIAPPVGIVVPAIPAEAHVLDVNGQTFYRSKGIFYVQVQQGYQVIAPVQDLLDAS